MTRTTPKERKRRRTTRARTTPKRRSSARGPEPSIPAVLVDASETADVVTVPPRSVLSIASHGAPEAPIFAASVAAVYGLAYALKFARKKRSGSDFKIAPLEVQWWAAGLARPLPEVPRDEWHWELRLALPQDVTPTELAAVVEAVTTRRGGRLEGSAVARGARVKQLGTARYGRVLHVGSYAEEARSFAKITEALRAAGLSARHRHLEVYLNDPSRTKPERLKTVLLLEIA